MSALLAPHSRETTNRPTLRAVDRRPTRLARIPFVIVLAIYVGIGLVGVLVLNVQLQQRAAQLNDLTAQDTQLGYQRDALAAQVNQMSSTTGLMQSAAKMGMVPNPNPAFIDLRTNTIIGKPTPVTGTMPTLGQYVPANQQDQVLAAQHSSTSAASASAQPSASASPSTAAAKPGATASAKPAATAPTSAPATAGGHR